MNIVNKLKVVAPILSITLAII